MPPFISRKRHASTPPAEQPLPKKSKASGPSQTREAPAASTVHDKRRFLDSLAGSDESSLSDADSDDFEDVMPQAEADGESEEDDADWEDALKPESVSVSAAPRPVLGGDLELTLGDRNETISYTDGKKKGPSKLDRQKRLNAHRMHVQFLMFHNAVRNAWACDKKTQEILVSQLPSQIQQVVNTWKLDCGDRLGSDRKGKRSVWKGNSKKPKKRGEQKHPRDWGGTADRLEEGTVNLSHGDPTIRLLKYLARYWQKRFRVIAPGLRKIGHRPVRELQKDIQSFRNEKHNPQEHGERVASIVGFRQSAKRCEGSRDLGAQLFISLLRGLGIETRLVANLQPTGFGWNKNEDAPPRKRTKQEVDLIEDDQSNEIDEDEVEQRSQAHGVSGSKVASSRSRRPSRRAQDDIHNGSKETPFDLSSDSELSETISASDDSVVEITPLPKKKPAARKFDRDLKFPVYWAEVVSPVLLKVYPVDPILQGAPATSEDRLADFEPRGSKAEKAKQVIAYVIAHSSDGTAKDVTTRYLKRHLWPGKTKGVRVPPEKVPIHNKRGKVKRYEEYDWFKTVMSSYKRRDKQRTEVDDIEDATDLKPAESVKRPIKEGDESLQWYKQSADFCLERLLRREEALIPGAEAVRIFKSGKGENAKEEPVFRREDVVPVKTEESWHKEGRQPKPDALPLKHAPFRAVTTARKREIEELTRRNNGIKPMQGLFSKAQTEYIIPPPIENGVIPKNQYGNIDCFVPRMVPKGAVHVPYRGLVKVCKKLEIDYAEAVTGFEFGNRMAVPVVQGVVVAAEHEPALLSAWEEEEEKRRIKEDEKRQTLILGTWRKFLMGLRILEKMRTEYGADDVDRAKDSVNPFTNPNKTRQAPTSAEDGIGGGFLLEEEDPEQEQGSTGELEIVDDRKDRRNPSIGGGVTTATPEEASEKVFDHSHEDSASSELSSQPVESDDEEVSDSEVAPPKRASTRKQPQQKALPKKTPSRRSARSSGRKSTYFEGSSHDDTGHDETDAGITGLKESEDDEPRSLARTKPTKPQIQKIKTSYQTKTPSKGTSNKGRGRGRPRKTL